MWAAFCAHTGPGGGDTVRLVLCTYRSPASRWGQARSDQLAGGLPSFETRDCAAGANGTLNPATPTDPDFIARVSPVLLNTPAQLFQQIQDFSFGGGLSTTGVPRVACTQQAPVSSIGQVAEVTDYLHVYQNAP